MAATGAAVNIKKPQFLSPGQMGNIVEKFRECGNDNLLLCERGAQLGYDNLVVDMLGFRTMMEVSGGAPLVFDVTHSLQCRAPQGAASGGSPAGRWRNWRGRGWRPALPACSWNPTRTPDQARCDGPSALPLDKLEAFLQQMKAVDELVKSLPPLPIDEE